MHPFGDSKPPKVLVVDDEAQNLQLVGEVLRRANIAFIVAINADEALKAVEREDPDLILLDVMMPGMDGIELCTKLKGASQTSDIPVIFLTAATSISDILTGFATGAVDYVKKPFVREELLARVSTHLQLSSAQKELNQQAATKAELLARLAHDVKNPSGAIVGLAKFVIEDISEIENEKKDELLSMLNLIVESAEGMTDLVNGILDDARQSADASSNGDSESIDVSEAVEHLVKLNTLQARTKGIQIHFNPETFSPRIAISRRILIEMFDNLLSNAIKYSAQSTQISVRLTPSRELSAGLRFEVEDGAQTIPSEQAAKLFQVFAKGESTAPKNQSSHGVGLAIVQRLVDLHAGIVGVEARPKGPGNIFYIELPHARLS